MEIQEMLLKYKYHIALILLTTSILVFTIFLAPSFLTILTYFWPLLLSTALFLVLVVIFGRKSSLQPVTDSSGDKLAGEELLYYVAGQPNPSVQSLSSE